MALRGEMRLGLEAELFKLIMSKDDILCWLLLTSLLPEARATKSVFAGMTEPLT